MVVGRITFSEHFVRYKFHSLCTDFEPSLDDFRIHGARFIAEEHEIKDSLVGYRGVLNEAQRSVYCNHAYML